MEKTTNKQQSPAEDRMAINAQNLSKITDRVKTEALAKKRAAYEEARKKEAEASTGLTQKREAEERQRKWQRTEADNLFPQFLESLEHYLEAVARRGRRSAEVLGYQHPLFCRGRLRDDGFILSHLSRSPIVSEN